MGHSLIVVEHNLQLMKAADYIIDLGPGAADEGGRVVAHGTPEAVARVKESVTGRFLAKALAADERAAEERLVAAHATGRFRPAHGANPSLRGSPPAAAQFPIPGSASRSSRQQSRLRLPESQNTVNAG